MKSVLQDWVMCLPLRHQGVLLTGVRGCDVQPKYPLDATARQLTGYLRYCFLNPADAREVGTVGAFFQNMPPAEGWKASELGHLPQHWYSHIMHGFEVVAYHHPDIAVRGRAFDIYLKLVASMHLRFETMQAMDLRLTEDRIANNTVVS